MAGTQNVGGSIKEDRHQEEQDHVDESITSLSSHYYCKVRTGEECGSVDAATAIIMVESREARGEENRKAPDE